jgi:hypothetical protein
VSSILELFFEDLIEEEKSYVCSITVPQSAQQKFNNGCTGFVTNG